MELSLAPAAYTLIAINCALSAYGLFVDRKFLYQFVFEVKAIRERHEWWRLVTCSFLHGSPFHLLVNMLSLYLLGPSVEYVLGTTGFLLVYFGSQLAAMGLSLAIKWNQLDYSALGASGAVSGVVLSFCTFAPMQTLYVMGLVPVPAFAVAIVYIAYTSFVMRGESNIAHEAHLGGAVGGILLTLMLMPGIPFLA